MQNSHLNISALVVISVIRSLLFDIEYMEPSGDLNPIVPTEEMW